MMRRGAEGAALDGADVTGGGDRCRLPPVSLARLFGFRRAVRVRPVAETEEARAVPSASNGDTSGVLLQDGNIRLQANHIGLYASQYRNYNIFYLIGYAIYIVFLSLLKVILG